MDGIAHVPEGDLDNAPYWYERAKRIERIRSPI